jgi:Endonuclease-reverse transcriptase
MSQRGHRHHSGRHRSRQPSGNKELTVAWCNAHKSQPPHVALLQLCWEQGVKIIQVQEPWVGSGSRTQNHPGYQPYTPLDSWETRGEGPRVLTYIRKGAGLQVQQKRPLPSRDILWLEANGCTLLNIYRKPNTDEVLDYVTQLQPPSRCLVGGDFNVWHPLFEPGVTGKGGGAALVAWAAESGMDFIGQPGVATHKGGHVIDLTFSNIPFATTVVKGELSTGSDHSTLLTTVPGVNENLDQHHYRVPEGRLETFAGLVGLGVATLPDPATVTTPDLLDNLVSQLHQVLATAVQTAGSPDRQEGRSAPWWTQGCRVAWKQYRAAERADPDSTSGTYTEEHRRFLSVVRRAKRDYWRKVIDGVKTDKELYAVVAWHRLGPRFGAPPLEADGRVIESTEEKARLLQEKVLQRFTDADDLDTDPLEGWDQAEATLPWDQGLALEE